MQITRADFQDKAVYIENAYQDVIANLQNAMAKYNRFLTTGDYDDLCGISAMLDESILALSDLIMTVNAEIPDVPNDVTESKSENASDSEVPF